MLPLAGRTPFARPPGNAAAVAAPPPCAVNVFFDFAPVLAYECPRARNGRSLKAAEELRPARPGPAPRRARHCSLRTRPVQGAGRRPPPQAVVERDAARAEPGSARPPSRARHRSWTFTRTVRPRALRDAIAAAYGLNPDRIVCGAGSDDMPVSYGPRIHRPWRGGHLHRARLRGLSDRHPCRRRCAGGGAGEASRPPMSTRSCRG